MQILQQQTPRHYSLGMLMIFVTGLLICDTYEASLMNRLIILSPDILISQEHCESITCIRLQL